MSDFSKTSQYDFLFDGLANAHPAIEADGKSAAFQFTGSPMDADWKSGADIHAYDFANSVSAHLGGYFTPGSGSLYEAYSDLIYSIEPAQGKDNPDYRSARATVMALQDQRTELKTTIANNYAAYKSAGGKESVTEWLNDLAGGSQYQDQLNTINEELATAQNNVNRIMHSLDAALFDAQKRLDQDKITYTMSDGTRVKKPRIEIEGDLGKDITRWTEYGDKDFDMDVVITKDSVIKSPWHKVYDTKVKHECLHTEVKTNVNVSRIIADNHYKLEVKFKGLTSYNIKLGDWFDETFVNPATDKFPEGGDTSADSYFGLNGSLHMIPSQVWIAYRPQIQLTVTTELYKEQYSALADANINWLDLLGFKFKFNGEASLKPVDNGDGSTTVTFDSPAAATPYVLGLTSLVRYDGSTKEELVAV